MTRVVFAMKGKILIALVFLTIDLFSSNIVQRVGSKFASLWTSYSTPCARRTESDNVHREDDLPPTNLIILSHMRSGSSFLGQILNHHPDVFYIYEPFYVLKSTTLAYSSFYESSASRLLNDIFSCSLETQEEFLNFLTNLPQRRYSSRALTVPFCMFNQTNRQTGKKRYICRRLEPKFTSQVCSSYGHRVVKLLTHRIPNFTVNFFKPLMTPGLNVRIVHLVRDPRAVVASMQAVGWVHSHTKSRSSISFKYRVKKFCLSMIDTIRFILEAEKNFPGRYKLLRYEDLVKDVSKSSSDVIRFAGLRPSDDVTRWVQESTHSKEMNSHKEDYDYTTNRRNVTNLIYSWRFKLNDKQILIVEQYCKHVMTLFKYPAVFS